MRLGFAAFSAQGYALAQRLAQVLGGTATRCGVDCPLRDWIREDRSVRYYLSDSVISYIKNTGLYQG